MAELAVEAGHLDPEDHAGGPAAARDDALVEATLAAHAPALLRTARRHSLCADDAFDAYQRALEIFVTRAGRLRRDTVPSWLHTVVKHEAMAVRAQRQQLVAGEEVDFDAHEAEREQSVEERVLGFDRAARAAEAFSRLKPHEVTALWLKAQGLSYQEIAERQGSTYTKVNRCLTEGRKAFLERFAGIESGAECERWAPALSALLDGEASGPELRALRPHLRRCAGCRASLRELRAGGTSLAGVLPVALVVPAVHGVGAEEGLRALLSRAWHAVSGGVQERATASAIHLQTATEAASAGKVAAVAASAAALAGGGAVAVHAERAALPASHRSPAARVAAQVVPVPAPEPRAARVSVRVAERQVAARRRPKPAPRARPAAADTRPPTATPPPPVATAPARAASSTAEFGVEAGGG